MATFPAGMVAGFAVAGWAVRRHGSEALLVASLSLVALGALGFVLADSLGVYVAARTLMGLGSGGVWIGVTFDTLERWPGQEYMCLSRVFAAYSIGGLLGPALGGFGGIHGPFLAYLVLLLIAMPAVLFVAAPDSRREFGTDRAALRTRAFWIASAAILFASLALGVLEGVLPALRRTPHPSPDRGHVRRRVPGPRRECHHLGGRRPRPLVFAAVFLSVAGISLAGIVANVPLWPLAVLLAAVGIGLGNTGSLGLLVEAVLVDRIVTAMVVWSQIGIVGYAVGPLAGGVVAEGPGYAFIGLVPATAGLLLIALLDPDRHPAIRTAPALYAGLMLLFTRKKLSGS